MWSTVKSWWASFEAWVASWMPGFKTHVVAGLGAVGSAAGVLQEYITGLPLSTFMTATQALIATTVLFTLAFWLRGIGDRVEARASNNT